jgi:hypothetical protein
MLSAAVPNILERDPLKLPLAAPPAAPAPSSADDLKAAAVGAVAGAVAVAAESKAESTDTPNAGTPASNPDPGLTPSPAPTPFAFEDPRVTYVTPPPNQGFGVYNSIAPRQIKFNVRQCSAGMAFCCYYEGVSCTS